MKLIHEEYGYNLNRLTIRDIKTYDDNSMENLKKIIKILTKGDSFYFEFVRENFFLEEEELVKYRREVPQYLKENGHYEVKFELDETRFRSIGYLPINEETYNQIIVLWKYFETLVFFNPNSTFSWQDFDKKFNRKKPEVSAIDFVKSKYANSVFIKGHDGDNLIFIYDNDFDKSLILDVMRGINS
ncbi:hypothetical protein [Desnuesiella massiliensis]|uniref:hypothetical protein n=1 Tax=Desnuesiella massiliensis TaxID=1650662 RepID=UPI0006E29411|nr:hypothetical protein [Desnuesiella massiliensis]